MLKVAVVAAAAVLLCLAGEPVYGVMLLNGSSNEFTTAVCNLQDDASRARASAAAGAASVTDLSYCKCERRNKDVPRIN